MAFKFLDGVCVTLTSKLEKTGTTLSINSTDMLKLTSAMSEGDCTFLTLTTPLGTEIVKVTAGCASAIVITRAQSGTSALTGASGSCLCFKINKAVLDAAGISAEVCSPTIVTAQPEYLKITAPATGECEWTVDLSDSLVALLKRLEADSPEDTCNNCTLSDGVYENATLTVVNGKVCAVTNGKNIVYTGGGCCGCS